MFDKLRGAFRTQTKIELCFNDDTSLVTSNGKLGGRKVEKRDSVASRAAGKVGTGIRDFFAKCGSKIGDIFAGSNRALSADEEMARRES